MSGVMERRWRTGCLAGLLCLFAWAAGAGEPASVQSDTPVCDVRLRQIFAVKHALVEIFAERAVATASSDPAVQCIVYAAWDFTLNELIAEFDRCHEFSVSETISIESIDVGVMMDWLGCRQGKSQVPPETAAVIAGPSGVRE